MLNSDSLYYTYMHRKAFVFTVNKVVTNEVDKFKLLTQSRFHDVDKMFLYTLLPHNLAHDYHLQHAHHHMENDVPKNIWDCMEAVIDYECAGFTKEDKPLNAYDTVMKYGKGNTDKLFSIMHEWGIAKSYQNTPDDAEWVEYAKTIPQPTDATYLAEIYSWVIHNPFNAKLALEYAKSCLVYTINFLS